MEVNDEYQRFFHHPLHLWSYLNDFILSKKENSRTTIINYNPHSIYTFPLKHKILINTLNLT